MFVRKNVSKIFGQPVLQVLLMIGSLVCLAALDVRAQEPGRSSGEPSVPAESQMKPSEDSELRAPPSGSSEGRRSLQPEGRVEPEAPPPGGCRYRERPLELLV